MMSGVSYDHEAFVSARERMHSAPMTLTPRDFEQLEIVSPSLVDQAYQLRTLAQRPPASVSVAAPTKKSANDALASHSAFSDDKHEFLRKYGKKTVTGSVLLRATSVLIDMIVTLKNLFAGLEQRVKELEARPSLKHCGIWIDGQPYSESNLVTRAGSLWLATRNQPGTPGARDSGWQLIVKSGMAR